MQSNLLEEIKQKQTLTMLLLLKYKQNSKPSGEINCPSQTYSIIPIFKIGVGCYIFLLIILDRKKKEKVEKQLKSITFMQTHLIAFF